MSQEELNKQKKKLHLTMIPVQKVHEQMLPDFLQSLQQRFLQTPQNAQQGSHTASTDLKTDDTPDEILENNPLAHDSYHHGGLGQPLKGLSNFRWNQKRYLRF